MIMKSFVSAIALSLAFGAAHAASAKRDVQELDSAQISMDKAIHMAEQEGNGKATSVKFKSEHQGAGAYDVSVLSSDGSKLTHYRLDAATGHITKAGNEPFKKVFTTLKPDEISGAQTSLTSAIDMAQQRADGKAIEAEVEHKGSAVRYDVKVAKSDGKTERVKIDASTGHVASAE